jgi:D-glycero-alpha-D-manno-heptose-7-phosphate kinase
VLALNAKAGSIEVQQLFSEELKSALEEYVTLVFSGKSRFSAINNWEVYKSFFDREEKVVRGLEKIATLSTKAVRSIIDRDYRKLLDLIIQEGLVRKTLFSNIETAEMSELLNELQQIDDRCGIKVCGAGGGGCFLIIHPEVPKSDVEKIVTEHEMKVLDFYIEEPL